MLKHVIAAIITATMLLGTSIVSAEIVNINKADAAALAENLNGIGPVKSKAIVNYRRKHGKFKSLEDLTNVDGIGEELVKSNRRSMSLTRGVSKASGKPKAASSRTGKKTKAKKTTRKKTAARKTTGKKSTSRKKKTKTAE
ncbi:MAG: competence protein ComEA [Gammaproteobacteria bacterium]|nr:MAG: competence protein ComEA [Gammaproteobacteria bacterium]